MKLNICLYNDYCQITNHCLYEGSLYMRKNNVKRIAATSMAFMTLGTSAYAGTVYKDYNVTVERLNGSGFTAYQTKKTTGANGSVKSQTVGGDYVVDFRMNSSTGNGDWTRDLTDKETRLLRASSIHTSGSKVRTEFSNDWNTPVAVQVMGTWRSN